MTAAKRKKAPRIFQSHMAQVEATLLEQSAVARTASHMTNRGTAREAFIRTYLRDHVGHNIGIGTGEIIDSSSTREQRRNQHDIVLYRRDFPKIYIGGGIDAFLAESVIATIEVKSKLTKEELTTSIGAAKKIKRLKRDLARPQSTTAEKAKRHSRIASYVVAYDGPKDMDTVYGWLKPIHRKYKIKIGKLGATLGERINVPSPSVDGIFVFGRGFVHFDNFPITWIWDPHREIDPNGKWGVCNKKGVSLLVLFIQLIVATGMTYGEWPNPLPYLEGVDLDVKLRP